MNGAGCIYVLYKHMAYPAYKGAYRKVIFGVSRRKRRATVECFVEKFPTEPAGCAPGRLANSSFASSELYRIAKLSK
jgi:hypothetical protein